MGTAGVREGRVRGPRGREPGRGGGTHAERWWAVSVERWVRPFWLCIGLRPRAPASRIPGAPRSPPAPKAGARCVWTSSRKEPLRPSQCQRGNKRERDPQPSHDSRRTQVRREFSLASSTSHIVWCGALTGFTHCPETCGFRHRDEIHVPRTKLA